MPPKLRVDLRYLNAKGIKRSPNGRHAANREGSAASGAGWHYKSVRRLQDV